MLLASMLSLLSIAQPSEYELCRPPPNLNSEEYFPRNKTAKLF